MTIRVFILAATMLAASGAVSTARAADPCVFKATSIPVYLAGTAGSVKNPYSGNFSEEFTVAFNKPDNCDLLYVEYDKIVDLQQGGITIPATLTSLNTGTSDNTRRTVNASENGVVFRVDVGLDDNGIPRGGSYSDPTVRIQLYDASTGGSPIDMIDYTLQLDVDKIMTLSLTGMGLSGSEVDLGNFEKGKKRSDIDPRLNLKATSNEPYTLEVTSEKKWKIVHTADDSYAIPYKLFIDGKDSVTSSTGDQATVKDGQVRALTFSVTPEQSQNLRAGRYQDEVTIIISGQ